MSSTSPAPRAPLTAPEECELDSIRIQDHGNLSGLEGGRKADNNDTPPDDAVHAKIVWNSSRLNMLKLLATFYSFIVAGANDAVYGAIIPYLEKYYSITYIIVSLVFLSPLVGYVAAATLNNTIHRKFGRRGVAILGPSAHVLSYIVISVHPPYPVLVIAFIFAGFGNGVIDAAWNAWIGIMANANELLGFLHGFYGLGAILSPLIATTLITKAGLSWYHFYLYVMIAAATLELAACVTVFWGETGKDFRVNIPKPNNGKKGLMREALGKRITWVCSVFLLIYVGIEVALGGWIVTFMIQVREGGGFESGMTSTGFWLGITVGRVVLGFVTPRLGENLAIPLYLAAGVGMEILFWLVPNFVVSSVAVAILGFFLGPLFPAAVVATTELLPGHLHVGAIGFGAAFGGSGACILPFAVGVIAQAAGVKVLQPVILAMLAVALLTWAFGVPSISGKPRYAGVKKLVSRLRRAPCGT
ncbi:hypothetical protein AJ79_01936 [Helicocarpus griseus UAMH5409]|uniref:Major facilitator superfamily (MFS) profile domain-containing protein n=1 Tax=Helicocarpus griseus UAMH5409 TaxID=1447875 RepID=A0A2B7Y4W3_9EURO|nr:hypothetical protein AJ79_01936 [Helicocarpus griseus UAMH5409]